MEEARRGSKIPLPSPRSIAAAVAKDIKAEAEGEKEQHNRNMDPDSLQPSPQPSPQKKTEQKPALTVKVEMEAATPQSKPVSIHSPNESVWTKKRQEEGVKDPLAVEKQHKEAALVAWEQSERRARQLEAALKDVKAERIQNLGVRKHEARTAE